VSLSVSIRQPFNYYERAHNYWWTYNYWRTYHDQQYNSVSDYYSSTDLSMSVPSILRYV
jgi:hypothetical protein